MAWAAVTRSLLPVISNVGGRGEQTACRASMSAGEVQGAVGDGGAAEGSVLHVSVLASSGFLASRRILAHGGQTCRRSRRPRS